ncbi:MAG: Unknown protein [uncultured Sulfurovum sp.]|uniref:Lipoprotein n=1 Tax=uncultured Sulfurovum sp. TaxID=269237 RepID=A0A6S6U3R5_9BACT|nr:MAG: Unknown protein [uncultured Sulfurovum sp.]
MKATNIKYLIIITLTASTLLGCIKHDNITSTKTVSKIPIAMTDTLKVTNNTPQYGENTNEIEAFLSTTPMGSKIYLEEKESGEWYLKVEKTFSVKKDEEKTEIIEPIYAESILI